MIAAAEDFSLTSQSVGDWHFDDDEATHIHEAGHAVAGTLLGLPFDHVSIIANDAERSNGHIRHYAPPHHWLHGKVAPNIDRALNGSILLMAGMAAQLRMQGIEADLNSAGAGDRQQLSMVSMLTAMMINPSGGRMTATSPETQAIQQWAWREACLMMANPRVWRAVQALGFHLLQHETATESEVAEIVAAEGVRYRPKRFRLAAPVR